MRVLICGAGIAGLTLAWCLERRGHDPVVVERAPHLRDDGYMIDFFGSGFDAAERLGLLPALESIHYPVDRLVFVNERGAERFAVPYPVLRKRLFANRVYGDLGWAVPELLAQCRSARSIYFDAVEQVRMPGWSTGRVVLLGDACQCVSPLAGQGASMALTAAYLLAEALDVDDVPRVLRRYEERLKPAIERQQEAGRRIAKWFVPEDTPHRIVRDLATRMSAWPGVAGLIKARMAAESVF